jgi:hypothetical protein
MPNAYVEPPSTSILQSKTALLNFQLFIHFITKCNKFFPFLFISYIEVFRTFVYSTSMYVSNLDVLLCCVQSFLCTSLLFSYVR